MTRNVLDLSRLPWRMGRSPRQPFGASPVDDRRAVTEWLPARVPGDVRADLIAAGRIAPVETLEGIAAGAWVDDFDWWYIATLDGDLSPQETAIVEADGIDYQSAIWCDEELLTRHTGMFARQTIILPPAFHRPGPHELAIRIWGGGALPRLPGSAATAAIRRLLGALNVGVEYYPDRMATTKAQFGFGWDFSPRLLSAGIWDNIRLVRVCGAYIEDLCIRADPTQPEVDPTPVTWRLRLRVARWRPGAVRAAVTIRPENFEGGGSEVAGRTVQLCSNDAPLCTDDYDLSLEMASARRWWPWDQGEPCLYRVTVRLTDARGVLDEVSVLTGIRSVARGPGWRFTVNERPIFLRGANWVPADVLPGRVADDDYARLLAQVRAANVNFLRVWGGGVREKRAFWETCDRLGLLVWQEFPLACAFLDHYPRDEAYLGLLESEARGMVRLLRNHPALIAWCGGNEINPRREALPLDRLARVVQEEDPDRPWIPASPSDGDAHRWDVWHGFAAWTALAEGGDPFMSEFGLQALPGQATLAEMFPDGAPLSPVDPRWAARLAQPGKLAYYCPPPGRRGADGPLATMEATQRAQAAALQYGIEACRLRREPLGDARSGPPADSPRCGGVAFWQFNEPWPAVTWSVIDRAGRPKAGYGAVQRAYQPVLVAARFPRRAYIPGETLDAEIWTVNDGPQPWPDCRIEVALDGEPVWQADGVSLPTGAARPVGRCAFRLSDTLPPRLLELTLLTPDRGSPLAYNRYDLGVLPAYGRQPVQAALMHALGRRLIGAG